MEPTVSRTTTEYRAGIDIGSTTVKLVILGPEGDNLFGECLRHRARTQETLAGMLRRAQELLGECRLRCAVTGSGAIGISAAAGIPFDGKKFVPHITVVRGAAGWKKQPLPLPKADMTASRISLMKSEQKNGKTVYTEIFGVDCK